MVRAIWNDTVLAETDDTVVVEGNRHFPPDSLDAWYHPSPKPAAEEIAGRIAFWRGVRVEEGSRTDGA